MHIEEGKFCRNAWSTSENFNCVKVHSFVAPRITQLTTPFSTTINNAIGLAGDIIFRTVFSAHKNIRYLYKK